MGNIFVYILNLPCSIRGYTTRDCDGDYSIYLNSNLTHEAQLEAYAHEVEHIKANHFDSEQKLLLCEEQASYSITFRY